MRKNLIFGFSSSKKISVFFETNQKFSFAQMSSTLAVARAFKTGLFQNRFLDIRKFQNRF
jgi:hypothetical protein